MDTVDQELRLILDPLGLPMQAPDLVSGAAQMPVLDLQGRQGLKVSVRSVPPPAQVAAWKSFRFQILSLGEGGESVAWESNNYPKPTGRNRVFSRTIKLADLASRLRRGRTTSRSTPTIRAARYLPSVVRWTPTTWRVGRRTSPSISS